MYGIRFTELVRQRESEWDHGVQHVTTATIPSKFDYNKLFRIFNVHITTNEKKQTIENEKFTECYNIPRIMISKTNIFINIVVSFHLVIRISMRVTLYFHFQVYLSIEITRILLEIKLLSGICIYEWIAAIYKFSCFNKVNKSFSRNSMLFQDNK